MKQDDKNKLVVLITGASKGIGKAIADLLKEERHVVYGTSRNGKNLSSLSSNGEDPPLVKLDVNDDKLVTNCVKTIINRESRIDVLINNAGFGLSGAIIDTTIEEAKLQFETNFFGAHRMIRAVVPHMIQQNNGYIINIGSFGGRVALLYQGFYSAAKAALGMLSDGLRMQLKDTNIKVSLIEPGNINTHFHENRLYVEQFENHPRAKAALEAMAEEEANAPDPIIVAKVVKKILKSKNPKPRYLVGKDAKMYEMARRFISDRRRESITFRYFKIPKEKKKAPKFDPRKEKIVILITGASSGIGRTTAEYLSKKGYTVYGTSRNGIPVDEIEIKNPSKAEFQLVQLDVNDDKSVKRCVNGILEKEGQIDVLINNAGFPLLGVIWKTSIEQAKLQFETNFFGAHRMILSVIPHMVERKKGCIINVSSIAGRICMSLIPFYSASKAALSIYTDALRMEIHEHGIKAATIEPGFVRTDFDKKTVFASKPPSRRNKKAMSNKKKSAKTKQKGISPLKVSKAIEKIITSPNPKPRYTVGKDAWAIRKMQAITTWNFQERIIYRMFKKPLRRVISAAMEEDNAS